MILEKKKSFFNSKSTEFSKYNINSFISEDHKKNAPLFIEIKSTKKLIEKNTISESVREFWKVYE